MISSHATRPAGPRETAVSVCTRCGVSSPETRQTRQKRRSRSVSRSGDRKLPSTASARGIRCFQVSRFLTPSR